MEERTTVKYWLFQAHPSVFRLRDALRVGALSTFELRAHKGKVKKGDKAIIWQTGKAAGCYALATIVGAPSEMAVPGSELPFYRKPPAFGLRVPLQIEYNLWNRPITSPMLPDSAVFEDFNAGLPGINYVATEAQYRDLENLVQQQDLANEPEADYEVVPWSRHPFNLILYGPPGTGKTYLTANYALSVIEGRSLDELALENRHELRRRFNDYVQAGRIAFVTFHQSFSYEDFVEGIKPYTLNEQVLYRVENGIFKIMCRDAHRSVLESVYRHYPEGEPAMEFNQVYNAFLDYLKEEGVDSFEGEQKSRIILHRILPFGDLSLRQPKSFAVQPVRKKNLQLMYQQFETAEQIEASGGDLRGIIGDVDPSLYWSVFLELKKFEMNYLLNKEEENGSGNGEAPLSKLDEYGMPFELPLVPEHILAQCNNYVLIIDEINRGNIPAIFGELITLLEEDKRDGRSEATTVILPYSKELFAVPPNLYLIGTMNTTDRSAEALDIALRRRFAFQAVPARPGLIPKLADGPQATGVDLQRMLEAINRRLELLIGEDYQVGHAYFLEVNGLDSLRATFEHHIIPLLQEYFFNDYGKIGLVLGREFIREKGTPPDVSVFADFDHPFAGEFSEKRVYELRPMEELTEAAFIRIYDGRYGQ
ncbi:MAG: EVE domain-containing protein [Phaeodactylibacter sp.]|nr:EVE domain-containing protein [Phaeodactylibacter sp.]MCB9265427.1 EVE domain-containing protein [Lewinellaceae bacterium]MCB9289806.1 EVE domain-containing protein [Lewinellaceae bacterium]